MPLIATRASAAYGAGFGKGATGSAFEPIGSFDSIATVTVPSGGVSSVTFSAIPTDYKHLQIRMLSRTTRVDLLDYVYLRFNNDTSANYSRRFISPGSGGTVQSYGETGVTGGLNIYSAGANQQAGVFAVGVFDIQDYNSSTKLKNARSYIGLHGNTNGGNISPNDILWSSNLPIEAITIIPISGNSWVEHSNFSLYGVR